jgi:hypothetical protein
MRANGTRKAGRSERQLEGEEALRYTIIIGKAGNNYSADVPDLPGCITTGPALEETRHNMQEA